MTCDLCMVHVLLMLMCIVMVHVYGSCVDVPWVCVDVHYVWFIRELVFLVLMVC
ncbi:hypothetical protein HanXRQr2_Chr16g0757981 [Helianthus annuus]|uniref:Uncharacterized protein n=1 Tax=Helianthus annuus TaxID=4232 RepID=A0A9K3DSX5_HELAN|nr:hypothetical protein HanXRQr2_Chr16g0757981 [Helianthus annuus]KAJ0630236.1 hypothetical protein HanHA300_Chr00c0379g0753441 [Helianthus annuus]KAJ0641569.1 hypothetical protein HanLR1_Chr16g0628701 [Helianthus annuus]